LAKRMRAAGDRDGSARVKGLRKPTVAAWAVNQVARTQRAALRELDESGAGLREAHAALLSGKGGGKQLRAASGRERDAVEALVTAARGLLSSAGRDLSETVLQEVRESLHAAASDDETRAEVLAGRLERERRVAGLGGELGLTAKEEAGLKARRAKEQAAPKTRRAKEGAPPKAPPADGGGRPRAPAQNAGPRAKPAR